MRFRTASAGQQHRSAATEPLERPIHLIFLPCIRRKKKILPTHASSTHLGEVAEGR
jgi:hypothetical protein